MKRAIPYPVALYALGLFAMLSAALPLADAEVGEPAKLFLAGAALTAALAQSMTCVFLLVLYRRTGRLSAAVLAGVFLAASVVAAGLPAAIPFGRGNDALLYLRPQAAAWLWIAWHVVFPAGSLAYAFVRLRERRDRYVAGRPRVVATVVLTGAAAGIIVVVTTLYGAAWLPQLVRGVDLSGYRTSGAGSLTLMLCGGAIIGLLRGRDRSARDNALLLALWAVTLEMTANLFAAHRFTLIWYVGRCLYLAASGFVLTSTVRDLVRWSGRAEYLRDRLERETLRTERHANRLSALWRTNSTARDDDAFLRAVLADARLALSEGREFHGFIGHVAGGEMVIDVASDTFVGPHVAVAGGRYPVYESFLGIVIAEEMTRSWSDIRTDGRFDRCERLRCVPWRAVIGTPFRVAQTLYYIWFASPAPLGGEGFSTLDHAYVETLASMCAARLQQRAQFERLRYQTEHDLLTGIYNRATFRGLGFAAVGGGEPVAVAVAALDGFRAVNDTLGHQTGDALLVEAAARLAAHASSEDVVARLGGDTFGILMRGVGTRAEAEVRVRRYASAFRDPFGTGDREGKERVVLSASFGIALAPGDAQGFEELLARADAAVYDAKAAGRARWAFFDRRIQADFAAARRLKDELAAALAREEFELYFQPHVELGTGRATGAEALIRWRHPARGLLAPGEFIAFAERNGFADQIGTWVMRETIRLSEPWRRADPSFRVWFNVSQCELYGATLEARLAEVEPGLRGVGVEITEGAVTENADEMSNAIAMLRDAGFAIALDDFGTGYSSLAHLRRLPIDVVKIDRTFIAGIPHEQHDVAIVEAVISIAETYGFSIVAEGVETMEQVAFLAAAGCTHGQGYLYARPMPADAFATWLSERRSAQARGVGDDVA